MPTNHICRLIAAAPVAGGKHIAIATWLNNNIGASTVPADLGPGLSPTGVAPPTYCWCCIALTAPEAKEVLSRLCTLAGVALPTVAQWDNATPAQRRTWWNGVRGNVWTNWGAWVQLADNDGVWDDPAAMLALRSLQPVAGGL